MEHLKIKLPRLRPTSFDTQSETRLETFQTETKQTVHRDKYPHREKVSKLHHSRTKLSENPLITYKKNHIRFSRFGKKSHLHLL